MHEIWQFLKNRNSRECLCEIPFCWLQPSGGGCVRKRSLDFKSDGRKVFPPLFGPDVAGQSHEDLPCRNRQRPIRSCRIHWANVSITCSPSGFSFIYRKHGIRIVTQQNNSSPILLPRRLLAERIEPWPTLEYETLRGSRAKTRWKSHRHSTLGTFYVKRSLD
jgi:hypothetical protein